MIWAILKKYVSAKIQILDKSDRLYRHGEHESKNN
jgi:hypothetical protein